MPYHDLILQGPEVKLKGLTFSQKCLRLRPEVSSYSLMEEHSNCCNATDVCVQETYRTVNSRMAQESLRRYVLRVLRVWRSWFIFSDDFINGLQVPLAFLVASCSMTDMNISY